MNHSFCSKIHYYGFGYFIVVAYCGLIVTQAFVVILLSCEIGIEQSELRWCDTDGKLPQMLSDSSEM